MASSGEKTGLPVLQCPYYRAAYHAFYPYLQIKDKPEKKIASPILIDLSSVLVMGLVDSETAEKAMQPSKDKTKKVTI